MEHHITTMGVVKKQEGGCTCVRQDWREGEILHKLSESEKMVENHLAPLVVFNLNSRYHCIRGMGVSPRYPQLDEETSKLTGKFHPTPTPPAWIDAVNDMEIATNRTVKRGHNGAAFLIHSRSNPGTLKLIIPVDSGPRGTTSYQTELFGILGAIIATHQLILVLEK